MLSQQSKQQWFVKASFAICLLGLIGVLTLTSFHRGGQLEQVLEAGELRIITRNSPTTYYQDRDQISGFEYELAKAFANDLGVRLKVTLAQSLEDLVTEVQLGRVHLAAAGLTKTNERQNQVAFGDPYLDVTQQLIYKTGQVAPKSIEDILQGKLMVTKYSSHAQYLRNIQQESVPQLSWIERDDAEVVELVQMVSDGEIDYTIVDSNEFEAISNFFPRVKVAFEMGEPQQLAWAFNKFGDDSLRAQAKRFFKEMRDSGQLLQLQERYYGHVNQIDSNGTLTFLKKVNKRLDNYQTMFEKAGEENDLDWRLIAAIAYQESHWKPKARSRTGVRGLMMLTRTTAKEMGVTNRLNPNQSVEGGSAYFAKLRDRFSEIAEPDRTWMALAAYNVGYGHVKDAQKITVQQGGDANRWMDVKDRLPLLTKKKYYQNTRHGYARGYEPVHYVQNIRRFYDLLVWRDQPEPTYAEQRVASSLFTASSNVYSTVPPLTSIH